MVDVVLNVCTCRRPDGLERLLVAVAELDFDGSLSVVVSDNDAKQAGVALCEAMAPDYRWPLKAEFVPTPGGAYARNHAAKLAIEQNPTYIACLDDDEWPEPQWLKELLRVVELPDTDVVSGPVLPVFPDDGAEPWKSTYPDLYGATRDLKDGQEALLYAAGNFLARRECFEDLMPHPFDLEVAKSGADDKVFFLRLKDKGYRMRWAADAIVLETVDPGRLSLAWLKDRQFRLGNSNVVVQRLFAPGAVSEAFRVVKTAGLSVVASLFLAVAFWHPTWRTRATLLLHKARGKIVAHVGGLKQYDGHGG